MMSIVAEFPAYHFSLFNKDKFDPMEYKREREYAITALKQELIKAILNAEIEEV